MARVDNTGGSGFTVDNGTGLVVRTKLNQVIGALSTLNQGSGEMSIGVAAYVPHIDGNTLKIRNAANNAFVSLGDVSLANFGHASLSSANTFTARATFSVTSSITLPSGTTAQRDGSPAVGMIRHNSETNTFEGYNNGAWGSLGAGSGGISNVVEDTSPQLGGNLDVQAFELNTSTSNGNIKLNPNGTGVVEVKGDGSSTNGKVQLNCSQNSHGVKLESPDHSASQSYTIKLPDNQIAADKFLKVKSISGSGSTAIGQLEFADGEGGVTSDAQSNTVGGTGAGASFSGTDATNNTLFGKDAGNDITTGDYNTAIGAFALDANTTGYESTVIGANASKATTTGRQNVAIGYNCFQANTIGKENVIIGQNAGYSSTEADENTFVGQSTGYYNTTGEKNTFIGRKTGQLNTTGTGNTFIGHKAAQSATTADNNTAIGTNAGDSVTTASNVTVIGYSAGQAKQTGDSLTAVGNSALYSATGNNNVAIGNNAAYSVSDGTDNVAIGHYSLMLGNPTGSTFLGSFAGYNSAGNNNTGIGVSTLNGVSGTNNTCLGANAATSAGDSSNQITLGDANITTLRCADTSISSLSDRRDKTDIVDLPIGLDFINSVRPVKFKWQTREGVPTKDGTIRAGFIAQELQEAQKDCDYLDLIHNDNPEKLEAKQGKLIPVLVKAIQELSAKVTALEAG